MSLPRAGTNTPAGLEKYLVSTVNVPPTTAPAGLGVTVGIPEIDDANVARDVSVVAGGTFGSASARPPTAKIEIKFQAPGSGPMAIVNTPIQASQKTFENTGESPDIWDLIKAVSRRTAQVQQGPSVPRFGIKRTGFTTPQNDSDYVGVAQNFEVWATLTPATPSGWGAISPLDCAPMVEMPDGTMRIVALLRGASPGMYTIQVYSYNPATDNLPTTSAMPPATSGLLTHLSGDALETTVSDTFATVPRIAAAVQDNELFIAVAGDVYIAIFVVHGTTLELVVKNIVLGEVGGAHLSAGLAMSFASGICTLAITRFSGFGTGGGRLGVAVAVARSGDVRRWGTNGLGAGMWQPITTLGGGFSAYPYDVERLRMHSRSSGLPESGYALARNGRIHYSRDAGVSWTPIASPFEPRWQTPATGVGAHTGLDVVWGATQADDVLYVSGHGLIAKSVNGGTAWTVLYSGYKLLGEVYRWGSDPSTDNGEITVTISPTAWAATNLLTNLQAIVSANNGQYVWAVGGGGLVLRSLDSGATWVVMSYFGSDKPYWDACVLPSSGLWTLVAVGWSGVHAGSKWVHSDNPTSTALPGTVAASVLQGSQVAAFTDAANAVVTILPAQLVTEANTPSTSQCNHVTTDGVDAYTVQNTGEVAKCTAAGVWTAQGTVGTLYGQTSYQIGGTIYAVSSDVLLVGLSRALYLSVKTDGVFSAWSAVTNMLDIATPTDLWARSDIGALLLGTRSGGVGQLYRLTTQPLDSAWPSLVTTEGNETLLVTSSASTGSVNVHRITGNTAFSLVASGLLPGAPTTSASIIHNIPRCDITTDPAASQLLITCGANRGVAANADGAVWVDALAQQLQLPYGALQDTDGWEMQSRQVAGSGIGPVWSSALALSGSQIRLWRAHAYSAVAPTHFVPLRADGSAQSIGVDSVVVAINGTPAVGDIYRISPSYDYPPDNLAQESPSLQWRNARGTSDIVFEYDRRHTDVEAVEGPGSHWNICGFALFGITMRYVTFAVSDPTVPVPSYPTQYTVFAWDGLVYAPSNGDDHVAASGTATGGFGNVLTDSTKKWIPGCFAKGDRQYFMTLNETTAYRILDSTETDLILDRPRLLTEAAIGVGATYAVYGDRAFWDGTGGTSPGSAGLLGSKYRFCQYARIIIPYANNPAPDDLYAIGTPRIGTYTTSRQWTGTETRHRFSMGFRFQPITNTIEQTGPSGVSLVEYFGGLQEWAATYDQALYHDRDTLFNALRKDQKLRKPFCWQPDGTDPQSIELVRLVDAPEIANTEGDRYTYGLKLREVK